MRAYRTGEVWDAGEWADTTPTTGRIWDRDRLPRQRAMVRHVLTAAAADGWGLIIGNGALDKGDNSTLRNYGDNVDAALTDVMSRVGVDIEIDERAAESWEVSYLILSPVGGGIAQIELNPDLERWATPDHIWTWTSVGWDSSPLRVYIDEAENALGGWGDHDTQA